MDGNRFPCGPNMTPKLGVAHAREKVLQTDVSRKAQQGTAGHRGPQQPTGREECDSGLENTFD